MNEDSGAYVIIKQPLKNAYKSWTSQESRQGSPAAI